MPLNPNDNPSIAELLRQAVDDEARVRVLNEQIRQLGQEMANKRKEMRSLYRTAHAERFKDFDVKKALIGGKSIHTLTIPEQVSFFLRPPSSQTRRAVEAFVPPPAKKDAPAQQLPVAYETTLLCWLCGVHLLADPAAKGMDLEALPLASKLERIRSLPELLLQRVAEECEVLETWLKICLEIDLGNF
jgi:hypothetical protein